MFGNSANGRLSGKNFIDGHSSSHTGSNGFAFEFISCSGAEQKDGHADTEWGYYNIL